MTRETQLLKILATALLVISLGKVAPVEAANPEHVKRLLETNECSRCDLSGANLSLAILVNANLRGANLRGANLSRADLSGANLSQADLRQANLNQAYLQKANLDQANLTGASTHGTRGLPIITASPPLVREPPLASLPALPRRDQISIAAPSSVPPPISRATWALPLPPSISSKPSSLVFDTIPQIAEARNYVQQRWKLPADLKQTLEYRLLINADGTIQRLTPLSEAARTYLQHAGIPLLGKPFVSPIAGGSQPTILIVLSPDGTVQAFLEKK